jgi:conjugal transfer pilus assembly protein TraV
MYQRAVNKKLAIMLKAPNTPLIAPPQVMRVLVLPYKGDMNELYMMRYIYLLIDDPKWVVGNYLIDAEE